MAHDGGVGLRLRIDARTALDRVAFKVPAGLLPRQTAKKHTVGFMRVFVAGQGQRKRFPLEFAKKRRGKLLVKGSGKPVVRYVRGGLEVRGLPAGSAVAELTIYRVRKLDGATKGRRVKLKARVMRAGSTGGLSLSVARAPRAERPLRARPAREREERELQASDAREEQPGRRSPERPSPTPPPARAATSARSKV